MKRHLFLRFFGFRNCGLGRRLATLAAGDGVWKDQSLEAAGAGAAAGAAAWVAGAI
jgi:hypothetical protein